MSSPVSHALLAPLSQFVAERMGLNFPAERWPDLARGMSSAARDFGYRDSDACVRWLLSLPPSDKRLEVLARHLTVGETYFLRDKAVFAFFSEQILPELISLRRKDERRLRIWSAGCATGEEPYSIAILLRQALSDVEGWNVTILATDINPGFLEKGSRGIYTDWSFRDQPAKFRAHHFTRTAGGFSEILPGFRRMVTFAVLNLAEDSYPSLWSNTNAMDVIFCRNVLMYFTPAQAQKAVRNLYRCLVDGGWLIVSASEASQTLFTGFRRIHLPGATVYRKDGAAGRCEPIPTLAGETSPFSLGAPVEPRPTMDDEFLQAPRWPGEALSEVVRTELAAAPIAQAEGKEGHDDPAVEVSSASPDEPRDANAMALLARAQADRGRLAEALESCEKAIAANKLDPACHFLCAAILLELQKVEEARATLKRALYLDPQFVLAHFALGNLVRQLGKLSEAERHFQNALALLRRYRPDEALPEAEGMTAGRLMDIIQSTRQVEKRT